MFLALDAGGTSTRAVIVRRDRSCVRLRTGGHRQPHRRRDRPCRRGDRRRRRTRRLAGGRPPRPRALGCVIAMAGQQTAAFLDQVSERLEALGVGSVILQPDLLGIFGSGTHELDGYALIAGTGSVAARVRDGRLDRVVGGRGWLLGDAGSGFWIGHQVARTVIAALDDAGAADRADRAGAHRDRDRGPELRRRPGPRAAAAPHRPVRRPAGRARRVRPAGLPSASADPAAREIVRRGVGGVGGADRGGAGARPARSGRRSVAASRCTECWPRPPALRRELAFRAAAGARVMPVADGVVGASCAGVARCRDRRRRRVVRARCRPRSRASLHEQP